MKGGGVVVKGAVGTTAAVVVEALLAEMMAISAGLMVVVARVKTAGLQDATSINLPA